MPGSRWSPARAEDARPRDVRTGRGHRRPRRAPSRRVLALGARVAPSRTLRPRTRCTLTHTEPSHAPQPHTRRPRPAPAPAPLPHRPLAPEGPSTAPANRAPSLPHASSRAVRDGPPRSTARPVPPARARPPTDRVALDPTAPPRGAQRARDPLRGPEFGVDSSCRADPIGAPDRYTPGPRRTAVPHRSARRVPPQVRRHPPHRSPAAPPGRSAHPSSARAPKGRDRIATAHRGRGRARQRQWARPGDRSPAASEARAPSTTVPDPTASTHANGVVERTPTAGPRERSREGRRLASVPDRRPQTRTPSPTASPSTDRNARARDARVPAPGARARRIDPDPTPERTHGFSQRVPVTGQPSFSQDP